MQLNGSDGWLSLARLDAMDPPLGVVGVWKGAFQRSFARLNELVPEPGAVLDVGGGDGALYSLYRGGGRYVLVDHDAACVERAAVPEKIVCDAVDMPFPDETFDVVISISTAQYIDHDALLTECLRVLKPGGILAMHENGSYNPVIISARIYSRLLATRRPALKKYNDSIKRYLNLPDAGDRATLEFAESFGLSTPIGFVLRLAGRKSWAEKLEPRLLTIDEKLLRYKPLRKLAWFRVFHLRKR